MNRRGFLSGLLAFTVPGVPLLAKDNAATGTLVFVREDTLESQFYLGAYIVRNLWTINGRAVYCAAEVDAALWDRSLDFRAEVRDALKRFARVHVESQT